VPTRIRTAAANVGTQITLTSGALLTLNADGTFAYDPNGQFESLQLGESGADSFTYTIADGNGGTDTATVNITVTGVNDAPVAQDDAVTTDEDTPLNGNVLLDNGNGADSDVESDILTVTGNSATSNGGTVTVNTDGTFSFDPNGDFEDLQVGESRDTTFTYTIADGNGGTDTATVTVTVTGVNDAPVAQDDAVTTDEDTPLNGNVLLDNGNGADSDVER
jgi:VCBS repeat-containing protein